MKLSASSSHRAPACRRDARPRSVATAAARRPSSREEVDLIVAAGRGPAEFCWITANAYKGRGLLPRVDPDLPELRRLLAIVGDPNIAFEDGYTPLHFSCYHKGTSETLEAMELLLKAGADPNAKTRGGLTPLDVVFDWSEWLENMQAIPEYGNLKTVELLLRGGADPNASRAAMQFAVAMGETCGRSEMFQDAEEFEKARVEEEAWRQELKQAGVPRDPLAAPASFVASREAREAAMQDDVVDVVRALLRAGADPNRKPEKGTFGITPLHDAIMAGGPSVGRIVTALLEAGADPHTVRAYRGISPSVDSTQYGFGKDFDDDCFDEEIGDKWVRDEDIGAVEIGDKLDGEGADVESTLSSLAHGVPDLDGLGLDAGASVVLSPLVLAISSGEDRRPSAAVVEALMPYVDCERSNTLSVPAGFMFETLRGWGQVREACTPLDLAEAILAAAEEDQVEAEEELTKGKAYSSGYSEAALRTAEAAKEMVQMLRAHGFKGATELR